MRRRFKILKQLLKAIEVDPSTSCSSTREEVQAGVFLSQLLHQELEHEGADVTEQIGYSFKWYDGPYSSSLEEDHCELVDQLRFESATDGASLDEDFPPVDCASRIMEHTNEPANWKRTRWLRFLSLVAYLRAGADWSLEGAQTEIEKVMDTRAAVEGKIRRAEEQLAQMGFQILAVA